MSSQPKLKLTLPFATSSVVASEIIKATTAAFLFEKALTTIVSDEESMLNYIIQIHRFILFLSL